VGREKWCRRFIFWVNALKVVQKDTLIYLIGFFHFLKIGSFFQGHGRRLFFFESRVFNWNPIAIVGIPSPYHLLWVTLDHFTYCRYPFTLSLTIGNPLPYHLIWVILHPITYYGYPFTLSPTMGIPSPYHLLWASLHPVTYYSIGRLAVSAALTFPRGLQKFSANFILTNPARSSSTMGWLRSVGALTL